MSQMAWVGTGLIASVLGTVLLVVTYSWGEAWRRRALAAEERLRVLFSHEYQRSATVEEMARSVNLPMAGGRVLRGYELQSQRDRGSRVGGGASFGMIASEPSRALFKDVEDPRD